MRCAMVKECLIFPLKEMIINPLIGIIYALESLEGSQYGIDVLHIFHVLTMAPLGLAGVEGVVASGRTVAMVQARSMAKKNAMNGMSDRMPDIL